ncbi:Clp protease N-terminal domain-containing protein [Rubrobacter aplysinae]|uniref:Clp protease N-terminal domain-containing protein n=1 Tax=Rubrobacter aplysinae TaxID=909625 RepID=UPI00064BE0F5|nr:Clp protease N-terminal domain-containing protein [Rubrobacter aplysinae]
MSEVAHTSGQLPAVEGVHRSVEIARKEAGGYSSVRVDTEHLLLGLLQHKKRRKNVVAWCLGEFGVTLRKVRDQVEETWIPDPRAEEEIEFSFTPHLRRVVEQARQEGSKLGHSVIDPSHLLLGLLEEREGGASRIFYNLDVDRVQVRQSVLRLYGTGD